MKETGIQWIGKIPDSWVLDRLQWHMEEVKESNNPIQTKQVLSLTNKLGVIPYEDKGEQGNKAKENVNEYKLAYPNTIVANSMNILIGSVGKCDYFGCVSPVYYVFKPKDNENIDFLNYIFQSTQFQKELRKYANGILEIRLRVSASDILKRQVAFPSLDVQDKIVNFLNKKTGEIDRLIEIENLQVEELKEYRQAIITEHLNKVENSYKKMRLRWLCEIISKGTTPSTIGRETMSNGPVRFLRAENIQNNQIDLTNEIFIDAETNELLSRSQLQENDILFVIAGATIGKTAVLNSYNLPANTNQAVSFIRLKNKNKTFVEYVWLFLQSNNVKEKLDFLSVQSAQPNLSMWDLGNFYIKVYDENTTKFIVDCITKKCKEIDALISIKQKKIDDLNEYKKSLIYEYVTGKKEVTA